MAAHHKTLQLIASKLGFDGEIKILRKAAEFERLLQVKSTIGTNMTDICKQVICLDLASAMYNANIDLNEAIKYSGSKRPVYMKFKKTVEKLLEINTDVLTIRNLCISLNCTAVESLAQQILDTYQKQVQMQIDLNLPQYVCVAVYQACRLNKTKMAKGKFIEKSLLKPTQWAKLEAMFTKIVDEHFVAAKKAKKISVTTNCENEMSENTKVTIDEKTEKQSTEPEIEPYDVWERRILEMAYKNLREKEFKEKMQLDAKADDTQYESQTNKKFSPRRSPRQKALENISPRKYPNKQNAIKLLFPANM